MVNYANSKIYKIEPTVPHPDEDVYYGATTKQYLCQRWSHHNGTYKRNKDGTSASVLFDKYGIDNCSIFLVEAFPCHSKDELKQKEGGYVRNNPCVNKRKPNGTRHESIKAMRENWTDEERERQRLRHNELQRIRRNNK